MISAGGNNDKNQIEILTSVLDLVYPSQNQISLALERFVAYNENPKQSPCVRDEVAESWIRSRSYGISMDIDPATKKVTSSTMKHVLKDNRTLIDVAKPILLKDLAFVRRHSDFSVWLYDRNGIMLLPINGGESYAHVIAGLDSSEEAIGTSCHSLSIFLDKPMLLIAPENYNRSIQDISAAISVPIHHGNGNLSGILTFSYSRENDVYLTSREMLSGMIAFQFSLVKKIENFMKEYERKIKTPVSNLKSHTFFDTLRLLTDDSIIAVNRLGEIQDMNSNAEKLLGVVSDHYKGRNISVIIDEEPRLVNALSSNKPTPDFSTTILTNGTKKDCVIRVVSVNPYEGVIIRFTKIKSPQEQSFENLNAIYTFDDILGDSAEIAKAKQLAQRFANTQRHVLLLGESGTGKELFAHSIHNASRPQGPFIAVNCASLPMGLIESEFYGYEAGSFTGADRKGRAGKLEIANGGTLFLDEIGDMPLELQPILLRVLEEKRVMRIGGNRYIPTNFRVIAATNKNLDELLTTKLFREDLYYRLSSLKIIIPSLKSHGQDIPLLVRYFTQKYCQEFNLPLPTIEPAAYKALLSYSWPGNIRELQNVVCIALGMTEEGIIKKKDLPQEILTNLSVNHLTNEIITIDQAEITAINSAMMSTGYNIKKAAIALGIGRTTLYQKLKKYNMCMRDSTQPNRLGSFHKP